MSWVEPESSRRATIQGRWFGAACAVAFVVYMVMYERPAAPDPKPKPRWDAECYLGGTWHTFEDMIRPSILVGGGDASSHVFVHNGRGIKLPKAACIVTESEER